MMKVRIITLYLIIAALAAMVFAGAGVPQSRPGAQEWERAWAAGTEFLILGNARVSNLTWHVRFIGVFLEPEAFTIDNVRAVFLSLSDKYAREDILRIYAYSDAKKQAEVARQLAEIQSGASEGRCGTSADDPAKLSAEYFRTDLREEFTYVPATGQPVQVELKAWSGECAPTGDPTLDLVAGSRLGCADLVEDLLERGVDPNTKSKYGGAALVEAAAKGQDEIVELLLKRGADVNQTSSSGWTPLLSAVRLDRLSTIHLLLSRGADVDIKSEDGQNALAFAVLRQKAHLIKELLAHGADVTLKDAGGRTPLGIAEEQHDVEAIRLLKAAGAIR